jgi:hypothetical protein
MPRKKKTLSIAAYKTGRGTLAERRAMEQAVRQAMAVMQKALQPIARWSAGPDLAAALRFMDILEDALRDEVIAGSKKWSDFLQAQVNSIADLSAADNPTKTIDQAVTRALHATAQKRAMAPRPNTLSHKIRAAGVTRYAEVKEKAPQLLDLYSKDQLTVAISKVKRGK